MMWIGAVARWLHFFFGVMWIGLLYYFNFVQAQALAQANAEGIGQGISKYVLPRALYFFRWAAVWTWVMGAILLESLGGFGNGGFVKAFTFQKFLQERAQFGVVVDDQYLHRLSFRIEYL